jgi:CRP-like cAMP-binding protein
MTAHMDDALTRLRELATMRVSQRLAHTLLRLTQPMKSGSSGAVTVPHALTRQELAELTGTTLFTVSRILTDWEPAGLVRSARARVEVIDAWVWLTALILIWSAGGFLAGLAGTQRRLDAYPSGTHNAQ